MSRLKTHYEIREGVADCKAGEGGLVRLRSLRLTRNRRMVTCKACGRKETSRKARAALNAALMENGLSEYAEK